MTLPAENSSWPPEAHAARYRRMVKPAAWYSGDVTRLAAAYGSGANPTSSSSITPAHGVVRRTIQAIRNEFWGTPNADGLDTRRHLPVAEDIARESARQLFSEQVTYAVVDPAATDEGELSAAGKATQKRLDTLVEQIGLDAILLAAAEVASALGSVGLRIAVNRATIPDRPTIASADPRSVVPYYSWGVQTGVAFWTVLEQNSDTKRTWRHIELHEGGTVYHGLYDGTEENLGRRADLREQAATAGLAELVDEFGAIVVVKADGTSAVTTAVSVPNMLPDPMDLANGTGRSDFTPAVMDLLDAIDRAYTQMMDALEDAKSRILLPDWMLDSTGAGQGASFDTNQRYFQRVRVPQGDRDGGGLPIEKVQFEMHLEEYLSGIDRLTQKAVQAAGYNSRSDAGEGGRDMTATEVRSDDTLTAGTRDTKILYWRPALAQLLSTLLRIDAEQFGTVVDQQRVQPMRVSVSFPPSVQPTMDQLAQTAGLLKAAGAASTYELVRLVHPDWSDTQVQTEVDRIMSAASVIDPVSFGTGGRGITAAEPEEPAEV